jgi:hypothetical protein
VGQYSVQLPGQISVQFNNSITPRRSLLFLLLLSKQVSVYSWVKFGCNFLALVGQISVQFNSLATHREREERQDTTTDTYAEQPAGGDLTVRAATGTTHSETTRQLSQTDSPAWSDAGPSQAWQQTHETRTTTTLHGGLIESGGDLNLEAGGDLTLTATTLEAGGHARLAARGDIRLDSLTGEARLTSERETDAGWFGLGLFNTEGEL